MDPTVAAAAGSGAAARAARAAATGATGAAGGRLGVLERRKNAAKLDLYHSTYLSLYLSISII